jgi:DNA-binding MarR family transcriptional regulator
MARAAVKPPSTDIGSTDISSTDISSTDISTVASSVRLSVTRLARILRQQDGGGLTPSTTSALAMLNRFGSMTLGELASREHLAAPTVTRIVEKLQVAGLVTRRVSEHDGRVVYVEVSEKGRRLMLDLRSRRTQWLIDHMEGLSAAELETLRRAAPILERIVDAAALEEDS